MYLQASTIAAGLVAGLRRLKSNGSTRSSPTESTSVLSASRLWARFQNSNRLSTRLQRASGPAQAQKALAPVCTGRFPLLFKSATRDASLRHIHTNADIVALLLDLHWISLYFGFAFIIIFYDNATKCIHVLYIYSYECSCKCIVKYCY